MRGGNDPLWRSPTPFLSDRQSLKAQDCLRDLMVLLTEFCQNVADMHCGRIAQFQVAQRERINGGLDAILPGGCTGQPTPMAVAAPDFFGRIPPESAPFPLPRSNPCAKQTVRGFTGL